jgi:uncharacterized protein YcfJ
MRDRQNQVVQMIAAAVGAAVTGVLIGACFAVVDGKAWGRNVLTAIAVPAGGLATYHWVGRYLRGNSRVKNSEKWQAAVDSTTEQLIDASQKQLSTFSATAFLPSFIGTEVGTEVPTEVATVPTKVTTKVGTTSQQFEGFLYEPDEISNEVTEATAPQEFSVDDNPWDDPIGSHFSTKAL